MLTITAAISEFKVKIVDCVDGVWMTVTFNLNPKQIDVPDEWVHSHYIMRPFSDRPMVLYKVTIRFSVTSFSLHNKRIIDSPIFV